MPNLCVQKGPFTGTGVPGQGGSRGLEGSALGRGSSSETPVRPRTTGGLARPWGEDEAHGAAGSQTGLTAQRIPARLPRAPQDGAAGRVTALSLSAGLKYPARGITWGPSQLSCCDKCRKPSGSSATDTDFSHSVAAEGLLTPHVVDRERASSLDGDVRVQTPPLRASPS